MAATTANYPCFWVRKPRDAGEVPCLSWVTVLVSDRGGVGPLDPPHHNPLLNGGVTSVSHVD